MEEMKIKYPEVKLRFNDLLVTAIRYNPVTKGGLILDGQGGGKAAKPPIMDMQIVVAAGENSSYSVGDLVKVNIDSFPKKPNNNASGIGDAGYTTVPPVEFIDGEVYLFITDRQLKYSMLKDPAQSNEERLKEYQKNIV